MQEEGKNTETIFSERDHKLEETTGKTIMDRVEDENKKKIQQFFNKKEIDAGYHKKWD